MTGVQHTEEEKLLAGTQNRKLAGHHTRGPLDCRAVGTANFDSGRSNVVTEVFSDDRNAVEAAIDVPMRG